MTRAILYMEDLVALARTHFVELTTTPTPGVWNLVITKRIGGYSAQSYVGELADVIARAVAGCPKDLR